jgi:hypothetical protein
MNRIRMAIVGVVASASLVGGVAALAPQAHAADGPLGLINLCITIKPNAPICINI